MTDSVNVADARPRDDVVIPFQTVQSGISGRLVRLGPIADEILRRHDYPDAVAEVMGEALALTAMLGSQMKFIGRLIVQTRSDGPLGFFVTNFQVPGQIRGYASFDEAGLAAFAGGTSEAGANDHGRLLGNGYLALTIDPGPEMDRYQGIVPLDAAPLSSVARTYFRQSEQLPTFIRLAVGRERSGEGDDGWHWRAGGLMVQHVSPEGGRPPPENAPVDFLLGDDDDHWQRVALLASTVEDHELVDPTLSPERLLFRLFHEEGVRVLEDQALSTFCQCSRERVETFLATFDGGDLDDLRTPDGGVEITCEFCRTAYGFSAEDIARHTDAAPEGD